jgi:hypothetical protein
MGEIKNEYEILIEEPEGNKYSGHIDKGELIILRWILRNLGVRMWTRFIRIRIRSRVGSSEHNHQPSRSIKGRVFLH